MQKNSTRDIRQLYKISSAGPEFRQEDDTVLLEKCNHIDSGREYSLRTFKKKLKSDTCGLSITKDLLELDHPNIMKIFDVFEVDDSIQIVFQKCEGTTLFREIQRMPGCRFDEKSSSQLISQILSSTKYLHRKHLLLREISLENVLVSKSSFGYDVKITDFGIRVSTSKKSYLQGMLGEGYDLYSIGLIAFSLATGIRLIVEKGNEEELSFSLQSREEFQSLSSDCKSFILACLSNISIFSTNSDSLQQHPWIYHDNSATSIDISPETFIKLKDYQKKSLVERILILAVSQSLTSSQLENIKREFLKFDEKFTGEISYSDFRKAFQYMNEEEVKQIFCAINILRTNIISYHEFVSALLTDRIVTERNVRSTFFQCCCSNQEYLMKADIRKYFSSDCSMEYILTLFSDAGLSADSFLSYNRFKKYVGFHYFERGIKTSTAAAAAVSISSPATKSSHKSSSKDLFISIGPPTSSNSSTNSSSSAVVSEEVVARRRLQSMTENMVTETTHIDVRSVYTVDNCEILGAGASGQIYQCRHRITGVIYALKSIDISHKSLKKVNALRQEIRILAKLDHPNIVRLHESFETRTAIHLVLDLCTGGELLDSLNDQPSRRFSEKIACRLIHDILGAVRYCHDHGITHRDLKLENFLFESSSENASIKLIDFGLSSYFDGSHYLTECIGTPYYVAPEVLAKQYDEKADVWSIGVIAYMLLTGTPLFNGEDDDDILQSIADGDVEYCSKFRTISTAGQDFINSCLIRDPVNRPSAQQAQSHSWFRSLQKKRHTISPQIFSNLHQFLTKRPLSRLFMMALAHAQKEEYLVEVRQAFTAINTSKSGEITYEELRKALLGTFSDRDVSTLTSMLDVERTGKISYRQFVAATLDLAELRERRWKMAFYKLSCHHDSCTLADVEALLGRNATSKEMDVLLLDWNKPYSSSITFTEFRDIVNGVYDTSAGVGVGLGVTDIDTTQPPGAAVTVAATTATITVSTSPNSPQIKSVRSTDSQGSPMVIRPPNNSNSPSPHFRRNVFKDTTQRSSLSPASASAAATLPSIEENNETIPDEQPRHQLQQPEKNNLAVAIGTSVDNSSSPKLSNNENDSTKHKQVNDLFLKSGQDAEKKSPSTKSSSSSSSSSSSGHHRYKLSDSKPSSSSSSNSPQLPWSGTTATATAATKPSDAALPPPATLTRASSSSKFQSTSDSPALPSISNNTGTTTKTPRRKGSLESRMRPLK